jgi:N-acyl amino acid synthase of PEP-CTERM/exosortase system
MVVDAGQVARDFQRYFTVVSASTPALKDEVYRIRYQVYAEELGWEDASRFPDGYERDAYDEDAIACLLQHRASGKFIGCARLVLVPLRSAARFPFEKIIAPLEEELATYSSGWRANAGEISRVAVISQFRRRRNERNRPDGFADEDTPSTEERRTFPHIAVGLYLGAAALGLSRNLHRVFAIMEPRLARRLRMYGIEFEAVGEPVEHHGVRVPYCLTRESFQRSTTTDIQALLEAIRADLDVQK